MLAPIVAVRSETARDYLCVLLLAASSGCTAPPHGAATPSAPAKPNGAATPSAPASSTPRASLRVGTSGDYAPFSTLSGAQAPTGFDAELALALGHDLGFEVTWVKFRWPELAARVTEGAFDVAMSGVTWQPERAVSGYLTRSVAHGGPCVIGARDARSVGVNHGGMLEAWARRTFGTRDLVIVDDNRSLPSLLALGQVQAIVTDSFERRAFARATDPVSCEAPLNQKVYWVAPARAKDLGPALDAWLQSHGPRIQQAQQRWFGERQPLDTTTHLVDLLARRFAFMPLVAAQKNAHGLPIEDLPREQEVLQAVERSAQRLGLPRTETAELFRIQIELSKAVQRRQSEATTLELGTQIRPALTALGDRILEALVEVRATRPTLTAQALEPLSVWLTPAEREQLLSALAAVQSGP